MAKIDKNRLLYVPNARLPEQRAQMEQLIADEICPFCPEHLEKNHREPITKEGVHWFVAPNDYPYPDAKLHLLLIPKRHVESFLELTPEERLEYFELMDWIAKEHDVRGGGLLMRWGEPELTGGTIYHLHAHFIAGNGDKPVITRVG